MRRWFVIQTQVHGEKGALFHLRNQGFNPYLPCYLKRRSHARKIEWIRSPMFPRYMFVSLDPEVDQWRAIRSTVGVSHFVCQGDRPTPVPEGIVEGIQARENDDGLVDLNLNREFKCGERVEVMHGPMADYVGIFKGADDQQRVFILLDIMGRQVKTRLPIGAIRATG